MTKINKKQVISSIRNLFQEKNLDYTEEPLEIIYKQWKDGKYNLISILSEHPKWDWEKMAVIMTIKDSREPEKGNCLTHLKPFADFSKEVSAAVVHPLTFYFKSSIDDDLCSELCQRGVDAKPKQKLSRALGQYFKKMGLDKTMPDYEKYFAKLADSMNPLSVERTSLLSVHPVDFLTMSNGNSWTSCHNLEGSYASGSISLMLDEVTTIFFTASDINHTNKKITRQCFYYDHGRLVQSRLYPCYERMQNIDMYRKTAQEIFSQCLGHPNLWTVDKNQKHIDDIIEEGLCSTAYNDCTQNINYGCTLSRLTSFPIMNQSISIGTSPICITCGSSHKVEASLSCCLSVKCGKCGEDLDEYEDRVLIDGLCYCCECCFWCPRCENFYTNDSCNEVIEIDSTITHVCDNCFNQYYSQCDDCGDYLNNDNIFVVLTTHGNHSCCDRCSESLQSCSGCGNYITRDDKKHVVNGHIYCDDCNPSPGNCEHC